MGVGEDEEAGEDKILSPHFQHLIPKALKHT